MRPSGHEQRQDDRRFGLVEDRIDGEIPDSADRSFRELNASGFCRRTTSVSTVFDASVTV